MRKRQWTPKLKRRKKQKKLTVSRLNLARIYVVLCFIGLVMFAVLCKCFMLQVVNSDEIQAQALTQWYKTTIDTAARGKIIDIKGNVLATSATTYRVLIEPNEIKSDDYERISTELAQVLELDYEYVYLRVSNTVYGTEEADKKSEYTLARQVSQELANKINHLDLGDGVVVQSDLKRSYPYGKLLSQVMGYTNIDGDGQSGLELDYEKYLAGEDGKTVTDRSGTGAQLPFGTQKTIEKVDGNDIVLTVDANIQYFLENALDEALSVNNAATAQGIIMNAKTGEIVAISTKPDYDPNDPPRDDIDELYALSRNRIVADAYEPGSTFKIITLASGLDSHSIDESYSCTCPGSKEVNGERIKCWRSAGHGTQTLTQCAENSCNCAFMDIALRMGTDTFYDYISAFGFGNVTGCGLSGESAGIVTHRKGIRDTDLARIGFGQSIAMTPIQLVCAVSAACNGGNLMQPYIVDKIISADGEIIQDNEPTVIRRVVSKETSSAVCEILESVVENGSGKNAKISGYKIGGKTGTAQKYENGKIADGKLIASFVGIAPIDDPEYVCLILVDEPQVGTIFGSTVAAPFVKQTLEATLEYAGYERENEEETVTVPDVCGMSVEQAKEKLREAGLDAAYQASDTVVNQVPAAGSVVVVGTPILLYTERTTAIKSNEKVETPKLIGLTKYEAYAALEALGLKMEIIGEHSGGRVKSQFPYYGDEIEVGGTVELKFE